MRKLELKRNTLGGKIIVFEGIDGSGKTTLIKFLQQYLTDKGLEVVYVKLPSDRVRNMKVFHDYDKSKDDTTRKTVDLTNLTIMVCGDRLIEQDEVVIPALKQNKIVICDRYCFSGYVICSQPIIYQISKRFIQPDLCFLCDCKVETAKNRIFARVNEKDDYYNKKDVIIQRKKFLQLAQKNNFKIINTDSDFEQCKQNLISIIDRAFDLKNK